MIYYMYYIFNIVYLNRKETYTAKKNFMGTCCLPIENSIKRRLDIRIIDYDSNL